MVIDKCFSFEKKMKLLCPNRYEKRYKRTCEVLSATVNTSHGSRFQIIIIIKIFCKFNSINYL